MPKVARYDFQKRNDAVVATIMERLIADHKEWKDLSAICGIHRNTIYVRKKNPDSFKLGELKKLNLTDDQIIQIYRGVIK
jgi:hypothetical protein